MTSHHRTETIEELVSQCQISDAMPLSERLFALCRVMSDRTGVEIELLFIDSDGNLTGATAACLDNRRVILCADSPSWYHRATIICHEFAHWLLDHAEIIDPDRLREIYPYLPDRSMQVVAARTHCQAGHDETAAEELASELVAALSRPAPVTTVSPEPLSRIAQTFAEAFLPKGGK